MWSMTGFGKSNGVYEGKKRSVEIRSLNGKGLDLNVKFPAQFRMLEPEVRARIGEVLERGKIDVGFYLEDGEVLQTGTLDQELAQAYLLELKKLSAEMRLPMNDWVSAVTQIPGVVKSSSSEPTDEEKQWMMGLLEDALAATVTFRGQEGAHLKRDLEEVLEGISALLQQLDPLEKERYTMVRHRLEQAIKEVGKEGADVGRLEQELLFYLDKLDISEEKIRLKSHLHFFQETLLTKASNGKKLGFIVQEMGREINTIGSKSNHAAMQRIVVEMKNHLEKIKEQTQNVL